MHLCFPAKIELTGKYPADQSVRPIRLQYSERESRMATTIRETCLDEHDTPNEHSVRIQTALTESFPEESLLFVPNTCSVFRRKDRHHTRSQRFDAFKKNKYSKVIFRVISEIESEMDKDAADEAAKPRADFAQRAAAKEAGVLGLETFEPHARPDGPSPDGKTWSYALGDWQDEGWLKAKAQGAPNRGGGGAHMT